MKNDEILETIKPEEASGIPIDDAQQDLFAKEDTGELQKEESVFTGEEVQVAGVIQTGKEFVKDIIKKSKVLAKPKESIFSKKKVEDTPETASQFFESNYNQANDLGEILKKKIIIDGQTVDELDPLKLKEALEKKELPKGTPKSTGAAFNYDLIADGDIKKVLEYFSKNVGYEKLDTKVLLDQASIVAKDLDLGDDLIAYLKSGIQAGDKFQRATSVAIVSLPTHLKTFTDEYLEAYLKNPESREAKKKLKLQHIALMQHVKMAKQLSAKAGQTTALYNRNRVVINMDKINEMLDNPKIDQEMKEWGLALKNTLRPEDKMKLITQGSKFDYAKKYIQSTYINGLLTATGTPVINFTSSLFFTLAQPFERLAAAGFGTAEQLLTFGRADSANRVRYGESMAMFSAVASTFKEALALSWKTLRQNESQYHKRLAEEKKLRQGGQSVEAETDMSKYGKAEVPTGLDAFQYGFTGKSSIIAHGMNYLNKINNLLGNRVLMAQDDFFKVLGYRMELQALAYRQASKYEDELRAQGMSPREAHAKALEKQYEILNNPPEDIDIASQDFAKVITFTKELDGYLEGMQQLSNKNLFIKTFIPFITTPSNIVLQALQRSPFAPVTAQFRKDIIAGGAARNLALAKLSSGSMLMYAATDLGHQGRLTGKGPGERDRYRTLWDSGWRPYSVVFRKGEYGKKVLAWLDSKEAELKEDIGGNKSDSLAKELGLYNIDNDGNLYIPFRYFEPASAVLAMGADLADYITYTDDASKINAVVVGSAVGVANYLSNSPFMQFFGKLSDVFGAHVKDRDAIIEDLLNAATQQATSLITMGIYGYSSLLRQISRGVDPIARDYKPHPDTPVGIKGVLTALNKWMYDTPGLSTKLPGRVNIWNEPVLRRNKVYPYLDLFGIRLEPESQRLVDKLMLGHIVDIPNKMRSPRARVSLDAFPVVGSFKGIDPRQLPRAELELSPAQKRAYHKYLNEVTTKVQLPKDENTGKFKQGYLFETFKKQLGLSDGSSYREIEIDVNLQQLLTHLMMTDEFNGVGVSQYEAKQNFLNKEVFNVFHNLAMYKLWNDSPDINAKDYNPAVGPDLRNRYIRIINEHSRTRPNDQNSRLLRNKLLGADVSENAQTTFTLSDIKKEMKK